MKKLLILTIFYLIVSCSNNCETLNQKVAACATATGCNFVDTGLTINNKDPYYKFTSQGLIFGDGQEICHSKMVGDTLFVKKGYARFEDSYSTEYKILLSGNCPAALNVKSIYKRYEYGPNMFINLTYFDKPIENFKVQEYIPNQLFVFRAKTNYVYGGALREDIAECWLDLTNMIWN